MDLTGIGSIAELAGTVIQRMFPDKTKIEQEEMAAALVEVQGQLDTNKVEAASENLFVAGWRPFVGWVCGSGFAIQFVVGPMCQWASAIAGHEVVFPPLDLGTMMPLLFGLLGLGGMRSFEKMYGVAGGH